MAERLQAFWIMKHWMGHVYPSTLRIRRKHCCAAFHVDYGVRHDNQVHKPVKVNLHRVRKRP